MNMGTRKYIMDRFQEHLHQGFETYCARHGLEPSENQFLAFIIDEELILPTVLQRYAVRKEFEQIRSAVKCTKSLAVDTLANRFHLSERTIWTILREAKSIRHPTQTSKCDTLISNENPVNRPSNGRTTAHQKQNESEQFWNKQ